ncbi:putative porin [Cellvibrio polysaccharolyticus]|nr:putative porin [Cellvibrio polysaccharolyticus]
MKKKILAASMLALLGSGAALAQPYQIEAGASLNHVDADHASSDTQFGAYGIYHFNQVQTANRPLAEAAFLQRSSNAYVRSSQDFDLIQAGAEFYIPDTIFYVAAELLRTDYDNSDHNNDWGVRAGVTPLEGLLVFTQYYDEVGYDFNVHAKYVMDLGYSNALNLEAGYTDFDHHNAVYVYGDYYFNRSFSAGVGYNDIHDNDAFTVRARNFFTPAIAGEAAFTKGNNFDQFTIGASIRF